MQLERSKWVFGPSKSLSLRKVMRKTGAGGSVRREAWGVRGAYESRNKERAPANGMTWLVSRQENTCTIKVPVVFLPSR
jgi:hypothetical protein